MKIPFSVYDFFGYLAAGFLVLAAIDFSCNGGWLLKDTMAPVFVMVWTVVAYILGHLVAHLASALLEHAFLRRFLGSPEEHLFGAKKKTWKARLFPANFRPFPKATQDRILARVADVGGPTFGRALFFHCHAIVKHQPVTLERLNVFLARYGFCRNVSMAAALAALVLAFSRVWCPSGAPDLFPWLPAALLAAIGMLYRYLKFFRHYTTEVFTSYAEADNAGGTSKE